MSAPWHAYLLLVSPAVIDAQLARVEAAGLVTPVPNRWQIELGALRMWHRALFRADTIGTCTQYPVRPSWRARALQYRPLRFPWLLRERAVAPWDMSGLFSTRERVIRHLLGAHHDADQFVYDLEMLSIHPGGLQELQARLERVVDGTDSRGSWLRDLCVYERYHESLAEGLERFVTELSARGRVPEPERDDPDIAFTSYLRWCARQPPTPRATFTAWTSGRFRFPDGLVAA